LALVVLVGVAAFAGCTLGRSGTMQQQCTGDSQCNDDDVCTPDNKAAGTAPAALQTPNDCKQVQCDGQGGIQTVAFDSDLPLPDAKYCTIESCSNGVPGHTHHALNDPCSENGGLYCDGGDNCVRCNDQTQCPAGTCQDPVCDGNNQCTTKPSQVGTPLPAGQQTLHDCMLDVCDGNGGQTTQIDDADVPVDGIECTSDVCTNGVPSNPAASSGSPCTIGGAVCNGLGDCVECVNDTQCKAPDTCFLQKWVCNCTPQTCASLGLTCGSASDGCTGSLSCDNAPIVCPSGFDCVVNCSGNHACASGSVTCPGGGLGCVVNCTAGSADTCDGLAVACSDDGPCRLACDSDTDVCTGATIGCGHNQCLATQANAASTPSCTAGLSCNACAP